jgi:hypothetical protein
LVFSRNMRDDSLDLAPLLVSKLMHLPKAFPQVEPLMLCNRMAHRM